VVLVGVLATGCGGSSPSTNSSSKSSSNSAKATTSKAKNSTEPGGGGGLFTADEPWTLDVSASTPSDRSEAIIAALNEAGGWGNDNVFQTDFSITVFEADASTPKVNVVAAKEFCYGGPDCSPLPAKMPIPEDATIEGSEDLTCDISGKTEGQEDCHLLVADRAENKLYEVYQANKVGDDLTVGGFWVWDLDKAYPETLRGDQCTSADAAGFPIAAMTPTADEVASGTIDHAIRFILPNDRMKKEVYVRPATHAGGPESEDPNAPPYGVRFRLKSDFDDSSYNAAQKTVIAALKKYGMLLSDGGQIALTFADDRTSKAKWADLELDAQSFSAITPAQFEVVELGEEIPLTYDCVPNS
jgi:serine/threonine-protein kinase